MLTTSVYPSEIWWAVLAGCVVPPTRTESVAVLSQAHRLNWPELASIRHPLENNDVPHLAQAGLPLLMIRRPLEDQLWSMIYRVQHILAPFTFHSASISAASAAAHCFQSDSFLSLSARNLATNLDFSDSKL
eukprot:scpid3854/ scgid23114/ 